MWFIGVKVEQEMSALPPKKKSCILPCKAQVNDNKMQKPEAYMA